MTSLTGLVVHERYFWHDTGSGAGIRTDVVDPYLHELMHMGGQQLMPHQAAVIDAAAAMVRRIPPGLED